MALRVYRLSKRVWYPLFCGALCFIQLAGGFAMFIITIKSRVMPEIGAKYLWLLSTTLGTAALVDICNTVALCYWLHRARTDAVARGYIALLSSTRQ